MNTTITEPAEVS